MRRAYPYVVFYTHGRFEIGRTVWETLFVLQGSGAVAAGACVEVVIQ